MKSLLRLLCLSVLLAVCFPAMAGSPYKPSDIQKALDQHDFATADREIQAVLIASPNSAMAHYWDAKVLTEEHHAGQALAEVEKAKALPAPAFKDPAKLAEFQANLAKAETDLQKTVNDEEAALAHPRTTTTTTTSHRVETIPLRSAPAAIVVPVRHYASPLPILLSFLALVLIVAAIVWIVRMMFTPKPQTVVINSTSSPDREYASSGAMGAQPGPMYRGSVASGPAMSGGMSSGHSTGAVVGAGLGGLAAGMLLDEALHNHGNGGFGYGNNGGFGNGGMGGGTVEEIDTTTTTTTTGYDDSQVQEDYQQDDQDFSSVGGDSFDDSSFDSGSSGGSDDSF